jgi:hypothetical protein
MTFIPTTTDDGSIFIRPSWKQLAAIPESVRKTQVLRALGIEVPSEGVSATLEDPRERILVYEQDGSFILHQYGRSTHYATGSEVIKALNWPASTPSGEVLRAYLRRWGWTPRKKEAPVEKPQQDTRTIV